MALLNVDIDLLRTYLTVLETQSFTRTAEILLRTQPAISQQIRKLEDTVGAPLVSRARNQIVPTTTGLVVKSYAESIIGLNDRMIADLLEAAPPVLRIGLPDDFAAVFLPEILRIASLRLPETEISFFADFSVSLAKRVAKGELDLAIMAAEPDQPSLHVVNEPLVWVAHPDFDLHQRPLPIAVFHAACTIRQAGIDALRDVGIPPRISHSSNANAMLVTAVTGGHAVGIMPSCTARHAGLTVVDDGRLPDLPTIAIALQIRDQANPAIRELALSAIAALGHDGTHGTDSLATANEPAQTGPFAATS
jgi:DNA-binding transcriptional LysR family regulator